MPAINFPDAPSVSQIHSEAGITWIWTGTTWDVVPPTNTQFVDIQDENDTIYAQQGKLKFIGATVVADPGNERNIIRRKQESHYRFELVTIIDQDLWRYNSVITAITKTAGVATAEYDINGGGYTLISFTGDTWTGTLNITANDVLKWRITYTGGYTTCALVVEHNRV